MHIIKYWYMNLNEFNHATNSHFQKPLPFSPPPFPKKKENQVKL